jgi:hypothetical protein
MPPVGLEPAIPASERPQTHALDRAATGIAPSNGYDNLQRVALYILYTARTNTEGCVRISSDEPVRLGR